MIGALLGQREADEPTAKPGHEVNRFRSDKLGGQRQVASFSRSSSSTNDRHAAGANLGQRAGNVGKWGFDGAG